MSKVWDVCLMFGGAIVGGLSYVYGQFDGFIGILIAFICIDYLTGIIGAVVNKKLSSNVGFIGLCRKVIILIVVGVGGLLDRLLKTGDSFRNMMCFFYIANEGLSIVENCDIIGIPIPKKLLSILYEIKQKGDDTEERGLTDDNKEL